MASEPFDQQRDPRNSVQRQITDAEQSLRMENQQLAIQLADAARRVEILQGCLRWAIKELDRLMGIAHD
jgi:hypothetical protein